MAPTRPRTAAPATAPGGLTVFQRLAGFSARRRRWVIAVWVIVTAVAAPLAVTLTGALSGAGWDAQGSTAEQVRRELRRDFAELGAEDAMVVYRQTRPVADDPAALEALVRDVRDAPGALRVVNPLDQPSDAGLVSRDGRTALIPVALEATDDADLPESAGEVGDFVADLELSPGARAEVTGEWSMWSDFNSENEDAMQRAELLAAIPSMVLLVVAFGSIVAAALPMALAMAGIALGFATLHLLTAVTPISVWAMNFSMMMGLAVGIDYSLFIVSRYREERAGGKDAVEGLQATLATAGKAVFLSALTVVLSLGAIFLVPVMVFRSMALGMILSVAAVSLAALTLLPAVLAALGDRVLVHRGTAEDPDVHAEGRWVRWAGRAIARPWLSLAIGVVLLGVLAVPTLGTRLGMPGPRIVDEGRPSRDGYEMLVEAFGPGAAAPAFVTVAANDAAEVVAIATARRDVVDARVVTEIAGSGRVAVRVTGKTPVDDPATSGLITGLRAALDESVAGARVGGPAAQNTDLTDALTGKAPLAIGVILVVAFVLLLLVFRSIWVPLKAIIMNLLSVGAAFGFATVVFQHGFGAGLIGIEHQGFVDAWAPFFFFAMLFGLSMDYQLFMLAAIRERYERHGDTRRAVKEGIAVTGRPITNAALIMVVVFIAFGVTGPIPPTELGVTLAIAVLVDATVVRILLVPSMMVLLGERNWWLPAWLARLLPEIRFAH